MRMYLNGEDILEVDRKPPFIHHGINEEDPCGSDVPKVSLSTATLTMRFY